MGKKSKIEWCDATWNPITGCLQGCEYCYARGIANRFGNCLSALGKVNVLDFPLFDIKNRVCAFPYNFEPTFHRYRLTDPARWTKPRTIFVCSMADLFGEWVPDEWIQEVFKACEAAPQHRYLFLTKNPRRYLALYDSKTLPYADNFWFGSTVTKPDEEFIWFQDTPYNGFISIEPMLERFGDYQGEHHPGWVIIGAETGRRKNKIVPEKAWIDDLVTVAKAEHIPLFMKDSLIPIVGEENMMREFPWRVQP